MKTESIGAPIVHSFFDPVTHTVSHVVVDKITMKAAVIDSVMDYEPNAAKISFESADRIIQFIKENGWEIEWIIETHVHADHLSAAPYIQKSLGGKLAIGENITTVQKVFGKVFNFATDFQREANQFDHLFKDGEKFKLGSIDAYVMHTPGHTPADMTYVIGDAAFVGDTLFMPDFGTARCDFPGGSAETLYDSVQMIFDLPDETRLFMCHDYLPKGRSEYLWETTVKAEKEHNIHVGKGNGREEFIAMRTQRDASLGMPRLIIPSIQVNINGGRLPESEESEIVYLKIPINKF